MRTSRSARRGDASVGAIVFASLLALVPGCARAPRGVPSFDAISVRHAEGRARREAVLGAMRADVVLRLDGRATGRLPAFAASVAIAAPDRVRLQAHALLGVVLDAAVREDSVLVRLPGERAAFLLGGAGESLGVTRPAAFVARVLAATWRPPAGAWGAARADSAGCTVAWRDGADSLELSVDASGRPHTLRFERGVHVVHVHYEEWQSVRGREFPTALSVRDDEGWVRARVRVEDLRFSARADEDWFEWRIPSTTRVLTWSDIRDLIRQEVQQP
ncbi:MAG: hypothetical protein HZA61_08475 [Candidatus Eisenbacteria bacterium]|uniref:DUF4292 domain-containing protein n=1 Tax=Eiseniibacteriota bacterium TaxID=2212470 RepID=A0A933SFP0_UNCEI|nr:hypothetical protein [Candidatus Eisenbacteria bacterium]